MDSHDQDFGMGRKMYRRESLNGVALAGVTLRPIQLSGGKARTRTLLPMSKRISPSWRQSNTKRCTRLAPKRHELV